MTFLRDCFLLAGLLLSFATQIEALDTNEQQLIASEKEILQPWFIGSIVAAAGHTLPAHHTAWEPYFCVTNNIGYYNSHWKAISEPNIITFQPLIVARHGFTDNFEIKVVTSLRSTFFNKANDTRISDSQFGIGFQALEDRQDSWIPDLRIELVQTFPTGHYQHLNPNKHYTDATGAGAYRTSLALNFQKLFILGTKLLRVRWNFDYTLSLPFHVEGFNTYGGGYGTSGKVKVGDRFFTVFALEYTFSQHWIGALDVVYDTNRKITFSGNRGVTLEKKPPCRQYPLDSNLA